MRRSRGEAPVEHRLRPPSQPANQPPEHSYFGGDPVTLGCASCPGLARPPKVSGVTSEDQRSEFAARMAFAKQESGRDAARRTEVALWVVAVTLTWLVSVSLLVGWGLTVPKQAGSSGSSTAAAVLAVFLPFVAAVIATRNRHFIIGGVYVVITLAMVLPALGIAQGGG
jgi:hypothetical protein